MLKEHFYKKYRGEKDMKKKKILNKIIISAVTVITAVSVCGRLTFAEENKLLFNPQTENMTVISDEIQVGDIIDSGTELVLEKLEDGTLKTLSYSENTRISCNHNQWEQYTNSTYKGIRKANSNTICYYNVYSAVYKCANKRCSAKRTIETNIPVKHNFKNSKCTECGRKKK
ncbi:hypothetical protein DW952_19195 [Ruminococcus sp. AM44-9AT]|jgi:hypothetical protein|nr:hypothetical protein DW952_19195 [Ruminococcus sp. AM44-9AT]